MPSAIADRINKIAAQQNEFLVSLDGKYQGQAQKLQQKLFDAVMEDVMGRLDVSGGQIVNNARNWGIVYDFERIWQDYQERYFMPSIQGIANDALKVTAMSKEYFQAMGMTTARAMQSFNEAARNIELMMGVERTREGMRFLAGGYLDRLLQGAEVKGQVMTILTDNVGVGSGFKDLYKTMKEAIAGSDQVDGTIEHYFRGYVYDTFSTVQRAYDNNVAETAEMEYFIYEGTAIETTRDWCREKIGQVFHRDVLDEWAAEDWAGKNPDVPVEVSLGGYNCRHQLQWIPEELVAEMGGELKEGEK